MLTHNGDEVGPQIVGEIVKAVRISSGMTPEQLAASAQLSTSYIRKLEAGLRQHVTLDTAKKLAEALGVSPSIFFQAEVPKSSPILVSPSNPQATRQLLQWTESLQMGIGAILEEDERLRILANAASEAIVVIDTNGTVLFVNQTLINILGLDGDPDQLMGFNALDLKALGKYVASGSVAEAHRLAITLPEIEEMRRTMETPFTIDLVRSDGALITVWVRGKIMEYRGETVYVAIVRDSSWESTVDLQSQSSTISWSAAWLDMISRGLVKHKGVEGQAVIIHNATKILYADDRAAALIGVDDPKELIGARPLSLVSRGSLTTVIDNMVDGSEGSATLDLVTKTGTATPVYLEWEMVRYRGTTVRVCCITSLAGHAQAST